MPLKDVVPVPATCVKLAAIMDAAVTFPAELITIAPSGTIAPTAPANTMSPRPALIVKDRGVTIEFSVPPNVIEPPFEFKIVGDCRTTAAAPKFMSVAPWVVIVPFNPTDEGAVAVMPPVN